MICDCNKTFALLIGLLNKTQKNLQLNIALEKEDTNDIKKKFLETVSQIKIRRCGCYMGQQLQRIIECHKEYKNLKDPNTYSVKLNRLFDKVFIIIYNSYNIPKQG